MMLRGATTLKLTPTAAHIYSLVTVLEIKLSGLSLQQWYDNPHNNCDHMDTIKGVTPKKTLTTIPHLYL